MANLITIDQLLESVDLDFEPRWVTQNAFGVVAIRSGKKPHPESPKWIGEIREYQDFGKIKLSEFEGKDWTECIYEVKPKVDQTKWKGKLCWFWDFNSNKQLGILTNINDNDDTYKFIRNNSEFWKHCEPVRPDDNVIYKGE